MTELLDFPEAMMAVIMGQKVHKLEWMDENIYGFKHKGFLMLHLADDTVRQWIISDGDLAGEDYVVL